MSTALKRGILLYSQGRHDLAEREFQRALAEDPDDPSGHVYLALCLSARDQDKKALDEAEEALRLAPDAAFVHWARGGILIALKRLPEAEASAREAIRIDPADADYRVILAQIQMAREKPKDALATADEALALDAQNLGARNLRAMALTSLGRNAEAAATLGEALAEDPEDAYSHANQGWVSLHASDPDKALIHFREALRLNPTMEWARVGIIEALKAKHAIYRQMLRFFLWMGRQSQVAQWAVILGFIFGRQLLAQLSATYPALRPFVIPILVLSFGFLILTWISSPLFNFLLWFNKFGRMALSPEEKLEAGLIGGAVLVALGCAVTAFATGSDVAFLGMAIAGLMLFPLRVTFVVENGRSRVIAGLVSVGILLLAMPMLLSVALGREVMLGNPKQAGEWFTMFVYACILSSWLPMLLRNRL